MKISFVVTFDLDKPDTIAPEVLERVRETLLSVVRKNTEAACGISVTLHELTPVQLIKAP